MAPVETPAVSRELSEFFQSPDDLLKIAAFRKKLMKEKASIDAKLKSGVKEQLDATRDGLKKLFGTRNNVQVIRDEMATVDSACRSTAKDVKMFDQISRVSIISVITSRLPSSRHSTHGATLRTQIVACDSPLVVCIGIAGSPKFCPDG